jgi:prophage regulatory protein
MKSTSRVLRLRDVCSRTGLSRTSMYRLARLGQFPKPIRLTRRTSGWLTEEIDDWIAARVAASRSSNSVPTAGQGS